MKTTTPDRAKLGADAFRFLAAPEQVAAITSASGEAARRFEGIAYSGDKIPGHWAWGDLVIDLSTTKGPQKLPMLLGHDRDKVVGFSESVTIANDIRVAGVLSKVTAEGRDVAALSDEGFPWQMSVDINPARVEEIGARENVTVNGRTFSGPITVFRNSTIREVSFTPTGMDSQTSATAMAASRSDAHVPRAAASDGPYEAAMSEARALASKANALMAEARGRGEYLDAVDAVRLARGGRASALERVALQARKMQHEFAERGDYLEIADAVHMIATGRA